jgi:TPR repeat protein
MAAAAKHPTAQYSLDCIYHWGLGVKENYQNAKDWFIKSARQGFSLAKHSLGLLYQSGHGIPQEARLRRHMSLRCCFEVPFTGLVVALGDTIAMVVKIPNPVLFSALNQQGFGIPKDLLQAKPRYRKAAVQEYKHYQSVTLGLDYSDLEMIS